MRSCWLNNPIILLRRRGDVDGGWASATMRRSVGGRVALRYRTLYGYGHTVQAHGPSCVVGLASAAVTAAMSRSSVRTSPRARENSARMRPRRRTSTRSHTVASSIKVGRFKKALRCPPRRYAGCRPSTAASSGRRSPRWARQASTRVAQSIVLLPPPPSVDCHLTDSGPGLISPSSEHAYGPTTGGGAGRSNSRSCISPSVSRDQTERRTFLSGLIETTVAP